MERYKMAIRVKRTDKLLFQEGITAHFITTELFEGGDVDFCSPVL